MLGLSPLDDVRHQHHWFLLLHHLARLLARSTFTRHREPIYLVLFLSITTRTPPPPLAPPGNTHLPVVFPFLSVSVFLLLLCC